jgi:Cu(I)/Ag(I) efflux system membrane fusion protein
MKNKWIFLIVLVVGIITGYFVSQWRMHTNGMTENTQDKPAKKERKIKYWVAPMDPKYRRDKPGKSPMGMDLVPVYESADSADENKNSIKISSRVVSNLGVVTAKARVEKLSREINTVGYVSANEDNIENVHSYIDGWIRNLRVTAVGDTVKKGQVLFELYSPSLVNAQQEFVLALKNNNSQLIGASKKKLLTLGLNQQQINALASSRRVKQEIAIYSNTDGVLSKLAIRDGMYIKPDKELMVIEDLSSVWVRVEVYEKESDWVKVGQIAIATFPGLPGKQWQGDVIYVYPTLDKTTHTLAVRLQFPNPNLTLKPDMYASVKIFVPQDKTSLVIPRQAVIMTGSGSHVILSLGKGRFKPQMVTLGDESQGMVAIEKGLSSGDEVVVSGQFLIDSESNLSAEFKRLDPHKDHKSKSHQHVKKEGSQSYLSTILAINVEKRRLTISHQPIESLGMPEMVMALPVKDGIDLDKLTVNQRVKIKLQKVSPNHYQIIDISPVNKEPL